MTHPRPPLRRLLGGAGATGLAVAVALALFPASASAAPEGRIVGADRAGAVAGSYLVTLRDTAEVRSRGASKVARELADRHGGSVTHVYTAALRGFAVKTNERAARRIAGDSRVRLVEQDGRAHVQGTQNPTPSWGLDRIDQRDLPLDNSYTYPNIGSGVTAYIIDTGIRTTHNDFGGRAVHGRDTVDGDNDATDCHGHGTHVAGTVGGTSYGVAKGVTLVAVRVLNCSGSGTWAGVVAGVDWVTSDHTSGPAVANMSLGGSGSNSTLENAVRNSIADGVTYAIAAGNSNSDACNFTPARTPEAITVGATDSSDNRASFSNYGTCLDIFAPGVSITSAWHTSDTATNTISGTSMASPHVAGGAALILGASPGLTPQQVRDTMVNNATPGKVINPGPGSPNLLLFVGGGDPPPPPDTVFADDFETDKGWTRNPTGGDTATTGLWSRGDPQQTSWNGFIMQRGDTTSGVNGMITDPLAGASVGERDIDGGATSVQSPQITVPSSGTSTLTFSWYLGHLSNSSTADYLRVSVVSGSGSSTVFQQLGAGTDNSAVWRTATVDLSGYAGQTIRLRIEAADASTASLVEAGVDDVVIVNS